MLRVANAPYISQTTHTAPEYFAAPVFNALAIVKFSVYYRFQDFKPLAHAGKKNMLDAINKGNFQEAEELIRNGEGIPDGIQYYDRMQLYDTMISKKGFGVLNTLAAKGQINTDVYRAASPNSSLSNKKQALLV